MQSFFSVECLCLVFCLIPVSHGCFPTRSPSTTTISPPTNPTTRTPTSTPAVTTRRTTTMRTTTVSTVCTAPNANSVGLTIDMGVTTDDTDPDIETAIAHCTSCTQSKRNFYTSATTSNYMDAEVALRVECFTAQLCVCNSANVCCSPPTDAEAPKFGIDFVPYCDPSGSCQMNMVFNTFRTNKFMCTNGDIYDAARELNATEQFRPLNSGAYFDAQRVSCRGCDNIMQDTCVPPTLSGPA